MEKALRDARPTHRVVLPEVQHLAPWGGGDRSLLAGVRAIESSMQMWEDISNSDATLFDSSRAQQSKRGIVKFPKRLSETSFPMCVKR